MKLLCGLLILLGVMGLSLQVGILPHSEWNWILELRLPRILLAAACGAGLAVAGAVLQAVFSNPLCEPYTLGISSGAALGSVVGLTISGRFNATFLIWAGFTLPAFIGALFFAAVLDFFSSKMRSVDFLLVGVMLGFFGSSLVAVWMAMADPSGVQAALSWLLGDLSRARMTGAVVALGLVIGAVALLYSWRNNLDALLMGELSAQTLGVSVARFRRKTVWVVSFLVAVCVSGAGMIGFVGLMVPHLVRKSGGALHQSVLPLSAVYGALVLVLADLVSRVVLSPIEIPVGVVTALAGAPVFFWVFRSGRVGQSS